MTQKYTAAEVLRIAKRLNNPKRAYLLVNPLQAKHMPVSPCAALKMMRALGKELYEKYPDTRLIIGFAETATAIGAAAAEAFGNDCAYIHTTREEVSAAKKWVLFSEEHSHAAEQKLCGDDLERLIGETKRMIFIDDELSTGKTLINIISNLRGQYPDMRDKEIIAASIINRLSPENEKRLLENGIRAECLVKLPCDDYTGYVNDIEVFPAEPIKAEDTGIKRLSPAVFFDPRIGVNAALYAQSCLDIAKKSAAELSGELSGCKSVLVLGTEECMYPALILGEVLEQKGAYDVFCHSATRSPIGISADEGYPIRSGFRLRSFYDEERTTFIYDLSRYDAAVIVSDASECEKGLSDIASALVECGTDRIFFLRGSCDVRHIS